jgi:aspartate aminotransferase-like enzyme
MLQAQSARRSKTSGASWSGQPDRQHRLHDDGVDVAVSARRKDLCRQTGSLSPPPASAPDAAKTARAPRCFFDFADMIRTNKDGYFPYTPATTLCGSRASLDMLFAEGQRLCAPSTCRERAAGGLGLGSMPAPKTEVH